MTSSTCSRRLLPLHGSLIDQGFGAVGCLGSKGEERPHAYEVNASPKQGLQVVHHAEEAQANGVVYFYAVAHASSYEISFQRMHYVQLIEQKQRLFGQCSEQYFITLCFSSVTLCSGDVTLRVRMRKT